MKIKVATGIGVGIALAVIAMILVLYIPNLAKIQSSSQPDSDSARTDVTIQMPDSGETKFIIDRPAIWNHEESRNFDNNSFTIKVAKTLPSSGSLYGRSIVPFSAHIHVTNHYMENSVTFNRWQNFTGANDWVTATFDEVNDSDTLFVTVYENNNPLMNLMESGRS